MRYILKQNFLVFKRHASFSSYLKGKTLGEVQLILFVVKLHNKLKILTRVYYVILEIVLTLQHYQINMEYNDVLHFRNFLEKA